MRIIIIIIIRTKNTQNAIITWYARAWCHSHLYRRSSVITSPQSRACTPFRAKLRVAQTARHEQPYTALYWSSCHCVALGRLISWYLSCWRVSPIHRSDWRGVAYCNIFNFLSNFNFFCNYTPHFLIGPCSLFVPKVPLIPSCDQSLMSRLRVASARRCAHVRERSSCSADVNDHCLCRKFRLVN